MAPNSNITPFLLQQQQGVSAVDAATEHLIDFPTDDIAVEVLEKSKKIRTMNHVLPEEPL